MPSTKILVSVVDDDQSMSRMLCRVLRSAGFDVTSYESAEEFLQSLPAEQCDCLILDMNLPGMSGIELQQHLLSLDLDIPIIFISADADESAQRRVVDSGAVAFFPKPFSVDSLLEGVRTVVSLSLT